MWRFWCLQWRKESVIDEHIPSSDGEENVGEQEFFDDQQDQQEFVNQGKYNMGLPWCPISL